MFLPDRYIAGACPNCGAPDQYGDSCESLRRDLRAHRPDRTRSRRVSGTHAGLSASPSTTSSGSAHFEAILREWTRSGTPAAPRRATSSTNGSTAGLRGLGHLARRALLRLRDSRRAGQVLLRLARRADRLPRELQEPVPAQRGLDFDDVLDAGQPTPSSITSSARTSSISTRCSGRRCSRRRATARRRACTCTAS